jgi:hypothetical protein
VDSVEFVPTRLRTLLVYLQHITDCLGFDSHDDVLPRLISTRVTYLLCKFLFPAAVLLDLWSATCRVSCICVMIGCRISVVLAAAPSDSQFRWQCSYRYSGWTTTKISMMILMMMMMMIISVNNFSIGCYSQKLTPRFAPTRNLTGPW